MPDEIVEHTSDKKPYQALSVAEMTREMKGQLPKGFEVYETTHYLIFHSTSRAYAHWCGTLLERLYTAFHTFWTRKGFDLAEPDSRLVAVIFADEASYLQYLHGELGGDGQYDRLLQPAHQPRDHVRSDRHPKRRPGQPPGQQPQINQVLSAPDAVRNVATIVHEATHQIAFNCGLHTRLSDCPKWFCEGIAVFCETPDLRSAKGWSGLGGVNPMRLPQFRQYLRRRPGDSLRTLISTDERFDDVKQGLDAYAEAWALTYFLIRQHPKQYVEYLRMLSAKKPMVTDTPQARIEQFQGHFGDLKRSTPSSSATWRKCDSKGGGRRGGKERKSPGTSASRGAHEVLIPPAVAARPRGWRRRSARSARRGAAACRRPSSRRPASARR